MNQPLQTYDDSAESQFDAEMRCAANPSLLNCRLRADGNIVLCAGEKKLLVLTREGCEDLGKMLQHAARMVR